MIIKAVQRKYKFKQFKTLQQKDKNKELNHFNRNTMHHV